MIFELDGHSITKNYFADLATSVANEFLKELNLNCAVKINPKNIITDPTEAKQYFLILAAQNIPKGDRKAYQEEIKRRVESQDSFFSQGVIYTPFLKSREEQFKCYGNLLIDYFMRCSQFIHEKAKAEGISLEELLEDYRVEDRYKNPKRRVSKGDILENYLYMGPDLPINAFTLKELAHESIHLTLKTKFCPIYDQTDPVIIETVAGLAQFYSMYRALPILLRNFCIYDFPQEFADKYKEDLLMTTIIRIEDRNQEKAKQLIERMNTKFSGSLTQGINFIGNALRSNVRTCDELVSLLN